VHAHHDALRKTGGEIDDARREGRLQHLADSFAQLGAEAVARHVDECGDVVRGAAAPDEDAGAGAFLQSEDAHGYAGQRFGIELEEFVPRKGLQNVEQRLAEVIVPVETGQAHGHVDLAAHQRDVPGRPDVGGGGEQADDAQFPRHLPGRVITADDDQIHGHAAVHARCERRLGDENRRFPFRDLADHPVRRSGIAGFIGGGGGSAQNAQPRPFRHGRAVLHHMFADSQKDEMVGRKPLQEGQDLRQLLHRHRRRHGLIFGDDILDPLTHGRPVEDRSPHVRVDFPYIAGQFRTLVVGEAPGMQVDDAFRPAMRSIGGAMADSQQIALRVAFHMDDRVQQQPHLQSLLRQIAEQRIDQKRHVVVQGLGHGHRGEFQRGNVRIHDLHLAVAGLSAGDERMDPADQPFEIRRGKTGEILRLCGGEERLGKDGESFAILVLLQFPDQGIQSRWQGFSGHGRNIRLCWGKVRSLMAACLIWTGGAPFRRDNLSHSAYAQTPVIERANPRRRIIFPCPARSLRPS